MGDYYKFKKILIILMIVSCGFNIIKNIFNTNVKAADDVNSSIQNGNYVVQTDNHFFTIKDLTRTFQDKHCIQLMVLLKQPDSYQAARDTCLKLYNIMINKDRTIFFYTITTAKGFFFQEIPLSTLVNSNITISGYTLDDAYNFNNVPFVTMNRSSTFPAYYVNPFSAVCGVNTTTGSINAALPSLGFLSYLWADVFREAGFLGNSGEYNSILSSIEETNELLYTQSYYTRELVENTYNSLNNSNVNTISSSGITQPNVNEPDLSDAFDSITDLLTNDNATTKTFTFTLPNNDSFNFSLDPNFLRTSLTRVGGSSLVTIIETLWYIGLYGLFIFTYLKILGALLAGDLDNVTGVLSPVNSVVSSSLEATGAFRTSGGDESAFRFRKG